MFSFFKKKTSATKDQKNQHSENKQTAVFTIDKMHCTSCALTIDGTLEENDCVLSAKTSYAKSQTTITYDPKKISPQQLETIIKSTGYEASLQS